MADFARNVAIAQAYRDTLKGIYDYMYEHRNTGAAIFASKNRKQVHDAWLTSKIYLEKMNSADPPDAYEQNMTVHMQENNLSELDFVDESGVASYPPPVTGRTVDRIIELLDEDEMEEAAYAQYYEDGSTTGSEYSVASTNPDQGGGRKKRRRSRKRRKTRKYRGGALDADMRWVFDQINTRGTGEIDFDDIVDAIDNYRPDISPRELRPMVLSTADPSTPRCFDPLTFNEFKKINNGFQHISEDNRVMDNGQRVPGDNNWNRLFEVILATRGAAGGGGGGGGQDGGRRRKKNENKAKKNGVEKGDIQRNV